MNTITNENNMGLMARYPDKYFDLAIVDPPYFKGPEKRLFYGNKESKVAKRRDYKPLETSWELPTMDYYRELVRVSKHQIIWGINYFDFPVGPGRIVWDKVNGSSSFSDCEIASCSMFDSVRLYRYMWNGMMHGSRADGAVMEGNKKLNEVRIHPTQKPVKLYEWILKNYTKKGDKILDTHLGSGSIAIAVDRINKIEGMDLHLTACELEKDYFDAALKRIKMETSQTMMTL